MSPVTPSSFEQGLATAEAARRLEKFGPNEIHREKAVSPWRILLGQFKGVMVWLLIAAAALSGILGEVVDAAAIGAILVINALIGFFQEFRAERALLALRAMTAPRARVLRDGHSVMIPAMEVVPGDILVLEAGDLVAADAKLLLAHSLQANEAPLTGESVPVEKNTQAIAESTPLAERHNQVFLGTAVTAGTGTAEVIATGMNTELGKIAGLLRTATDSETPLQQRLHKVSSSLLYLCLGVIAIVTLLGFLRGQHGLELLMSSVSLAVAAVPEGLAAIVTISLAVGVQRMASCNVLIRKLAAVETLGCTTVICTDKTGTLTTGIMIVREWRGSKLQELIYAAAACCDAELGDETSNDVGDPTEIAILRAAREHGIERPTIERGNPRQDEHPFDSQTKWMSVYRADGKLYVKGAVDVLIRMCSFGAEQALADNEEMAGRGLRVLAVAVGIGQNMENLELLGLIGMADPPRPEAVEAIAQAKSAGVRTVMITGDHPVTARAIGRELGIVSAGENADDFIHARVTAEDKLNIVRKWKERGEIVAMTGDGVNDSPALREAHIGIAMGKTGTEVTREASDMVLTDDNYASIVTAIREGRGIYDNIQKTLVYLLSGNMAELLVVLGALLMGWPLPLLPLHLLWINLVTDGLPAIALVMDPASPDVLKRKPVPLNAPMLGRSQWRYILWVGLIQAVVTLSVFVWSLKTHDITYARDFAFSVLVFGELFRAFAAQSKTKIFWKVGIFTNARLLAVVLLSAFMQVAIHHIPATQSLLQLERDSMAQCGIAVLCGLIPVTILELKKLMRSWSHKDK